MHATLLSNWYTEHVCSQLNGRLIETIHILNTWE